VSVSHVIPLFVPFPGDLHPLSGAVDVEVYLAEYRHVPPGSDQKPARYCPPNPRHSRGIISVHFSIARCTLSKRTGLEI